MAGIPEATHQQFLVLSFLVSGEKAGLILRAELAAVGEQKSGPSFYRFMARMEEAGFVEAWYVRKFVEEVPVKERHYRLARRGIEALDGSRAFYAPRLPTRKEEQDARILKR